MRKLNFKSGLVLSVFFQTLLLSFSCNHIQPAASSVVVGSATVPPDRKMIVKSDKKKQADLDIPFRGFDFEKKITKIALGSSADAELPQPIWKVIDAQSPDLFIFSGNTVFAAKKYQKPLVQQFKKLNSFPEFRNFREKTPFLVTWDNLDFGVNDGGSDNLDKDAFRTEFMRYWSYLNTAVPRGQKALYHSKIFGPKKQKVQFIVLDTRWDRSPLKKNLEDPANQPVELKPAVTEVVTPVIVTGVIPAPATPSTSPAPTPEVNSTASINPAVPVVMTEETKSTEIIHPKPYLADEDKSKHFLSEDQWAWLESELKRPSELKFLVSSIQVIANDHQFEKWGNFPLERERLFRLLVKTKTKNLIILSGDRHLGAIAKIEVKKLGPVYEMTSSGLNKDSQPGNILTDMTYFNDAFNKINFGIVKIDWDKHKVILEIHSALDEVKSSAEINF